MNCDICLRDNKDYSMCEINNTLKVCEECVKQMNAVFARQLAVNNIKYIRKHSI